MRFPSLAAAAGEPRADMTPLIDVVFQILIFFLCTLHFRQLEGRLDAYLPPGAGPAASSARTPDPVELGIRVLVSGERRQAADLERPWNGAGPFEFVGRQVAWRLGPHAYADRAALRAGLAALHARRPDLRLRLDPGPGTLQGEVLGTLDLVLEEGIADVGFRAAR